MVALAVEEPSIAALGEALAANDTQQAFEQAHKLKGAMANLALTPIFEPISELTELLRHKQQGDYRALYEEGVKQIEALKILL